MTDIWRDLHDLAGNLWWTQDDDASAIWPAIDAMRFGAEPNPVSLLLDLDPTTRRRVEADGELAERVRAALGRRAVALSRPPTWSSPDRLAGQRIAYLSMEFGLHPSLPIYSGGLGVLAGDHVRSASDLGVPLVAVGILWREGYFRQVLHQGRQVEAFPALDPARAPLRRVLDSGGHRVVIEVPVGARRVRLDAWRADMGRVPLYLLDADVDGNTPEDRRITARLYDGDGRGRLVQEVVLGLGAMALLRALGLPPDVVHLNEGHCALAVLDLMASAGAGDFDAALAAVRSRVVFTTHTPVPAGHDRFGVDDVRNVLGDWLGARGWSVEGLMRLGRVRPDDAGETLCMTVVALRASRAANGVAALHGVTSRVMWKELYPNRPVDQVPIGHVTNGVHPIAWVAPPVRTLLDRVAPDWRVRPWDDDVWTGLDGVDGATLRGVREACRARLREEIACRTGHRLDPGALVLGFARRFAPYKRADLLLSDLERLTPILQDAVVVYAGKAHPRDVHGKDILARVAAHARRADLRGRIVLLEDYDLTLGALLTSGVDVWVNTPRRPQEASGTSGQKAALNGVPNLSVLDGWWPEGFDGTNGWAVGEGTDALDAASQDSADRDALYATLANDVLPAWRDPVRWVEFVRRSIRTAGPRFTSHRMVRDYARSVYAAG